MINWVTQSVIVTNRIGLHARPAVSWTKLAKNFQSRIRMSTHAQGPWIDAKSIVKVLALKVRKDMTLHIQASGADADEAIVALASFVESEFDESQVNAALP